MAPIPGLPGASEPAFRTGDRGWMSLDDVVQETVSWLAADGIELSPFAVKATIQVTRRLLDASPELAEPDEPTGLFAQVQQELRRAGVLLRPGQAEQVVRVYASVVALLDIRDVSELGL